MSGDYYHTNSGRCTRSHTDTA